MTAKTGAERQKALDERRKAAGLKMVRLWCHPEDEDPIRQHAANLAAKRAKPQRGEKAT